jgi:hypothetical protein
MKPTRSSVCAGQKPTPELTETYAPGSVETYVFPLLFKEGERRKPGTLITAGRHRLPFDEPFKTRSSACRN